MGTISDVYSGARRLVMQLREGVEKLELLPVTSTETSEMARQLRTKLAELKEASAQMDSMWRVMLTRETASRRAIWKRQAMFCWVQFRSAYVMNVRTKVEQIAEETDSLGLALDKFSKKETRRQVEQKERAELLRRVMDDEDAGGGRQAMDFDEEAQALASVRRSGRMVQEAFAAATAVLESYAVQRERFKSTQRKVLDVINTVGLSSSLLSVIERRQKIDKWIVYLGMLVTVALMGKVWDAGAT
eukprot:jgi/Mesvir1/22412/Mv17893-RA.1